MDSDTPQIVSDRHPYAKPDRPENEEALDQHTSEGIQLVRAHGTLTRSIERAIEQRDALTRSLHEVHDDIERAVGERDQLRERIMEHYRADLAKKADPESRYR